MHLLGATRQGKSRLLQLLIQGDIERGYGCCLLDPSENGDTAEAVLRYCCSIGFKKVVYINPADFKTFNAVPVVNPIQYDMPAGVTIGNIKNAIQVLWQSEDFSETPRIEKYLPATLTALHAAGATLGDVKYFLDNDEDYYPRERGWLLSKLKDVDAPNFAVLNRAFTKKNTFENHYQPTVNRFMAFADPHLGLMFGSKGPAIPFAELIEDGWVILANLDTQAIWGKDTKPQRALGTMIVSEVIHGVFVARSRGWRSRFYLYIDEVGDFATPDIPYVIDKKSKTGLRLTVAHQRFEHIKDENVRSSIRSIGNKVMFFVRKEDDRRLMMSDMGYGGALPLDEVSYELGKTPKQEAVFTINKTNPTLARLVDVPDAEVTDQELRSFKEYIYSEYVWMHSVADIEKEVSERFSNAPSVNINPSKKAGRGGKGNKGAGKNRKDSKSGTGADRRPAGPGGQPAPEERGVEGFFSEEE